MDPCTGTTRPTSSANATGTAAAATNSLGEYCQGLLGVFVSSPALAWRFDRNTRGRALVHVAGAQCVRSSSGRRAEIQTAKATRISIVFFTDVYRLFRTFLGDFNPQKLPSGGLQTLWEWKIPEKKNSGCVKGSHVIKLYYD